MKISVVVCTYSTDRYDDFTEAVESVLAQTHDPIEIVLVIDGNPEVYARAVDDYGEEKNVVVHNNDENQGVSYSRTKGAMLASGEVVAFIDDDAVAEKDWAAKLVAAYKEYDAVAVGGRMEGEWLVGRPWFLPEEFNWLVGVTHRGFADPYKEVRNTFESNLSFRRESFLELDGFDPELGPTADEYSHSEGAELGTRLQDEYDRGVLYVPDAVVRHKVFTERTGFWWLCRRAFEQGVSKRSMEQRVDGRSDEEVGFLKQLITTYTIQRMRALVQEPTFTAFGQLVALYVFTGLVGFGYVSAVIRELLRN